MYKARELAMQRTLMIRQDLAATKTREAPCHWLPISEPVFLSFTSGPSLGKMNGKIKKEESIWNEMNIALPSHYTQKDTQLRGVTGSGRTERQQGKDCVHIVRLKCWQEELETCGLGTWGWHFHFFFSKIKWFHSNREDEKWKCVAGFVDKTTSFLFSKIREVLNPTLPKQLKGGLPKVEKIK